MASIFISRELEPDSPFLQLGAEWQVYHQSLVGFNALPFGVPPPHDWVFFSSKQAVGYYYGSKPYESEPPKLAALGAGTARALEQQLGRMPDFVGSGEPAEAAEAFGQVAAGQRVLFPQARHSQQSIARALGSRITALPLAVYDNKPIQQLDIPVCDYLIFTSPLNAEAYLGCCALLPHQKIIAIGRTTGMTLSRLGVKRVHISAQASEAALLETVWKLFES